jgi:hypothetical protein
MLKIVLANLHKNCNIGSIGWIADNLSCSCKNPPKTKLGKFLLGLKRQELRLLVSVVTEHCTLNNHMKTMRLVNSPRCAKCLDDETVKHFLCICLLFYRVRRRTLGDFELLISANRLYCPLLQRQEYLGR